MSREIVDSPCVQVLFQHDAPNSPIDLGVHRVLVGETSVECHARLRFVPDDTVELVVKSGETVSIRNIRVGGLVTLGLCDCNSTVKTYLRSTSSERSIYVPSQSPTQVRSQSTSISRAVFQLFNWPKFIGPDDYVLQTATGQTLCGRIKLEFGGWAVVVTATAATKNSIGALMDSGGYVITHVGSITRNDHDDFSTAELDSVLDFLTYYFSFILGRWSGPQLCVGFDKENQIVFEQWGLRQCTRGAWQGHSVLDKNHAEIFTENLLGFWALYSNAVWTSPLKETVYWYLTGNRIGPELGVDSALLFTQAALELLAWTHCVQDRGLTTATQFKGQKASDRLRLLLSDLRIPSDIPASVPTSIRDHWEDSMHALTDMRNNLVHPERTTVLPDDSYYHVWNLSMWFLDVTILGLCSYNGKYANRLTQEWVGQVENVPWVTDT